MAGQIPESYGEGRTSIPDSIDLDNRNKMQGMMFPGSTISHAMIRPDKSQKAVMKHKWDGTSEWNWNDPDARKAAFDYDNHPEVQARRWEKMNWHERMMCGSPQMNKIAFYGFNMTVTFFFFRFWLSSVKATVIPMTLFWGSLGYVFSGPEMS